MPGWTGLIAPGTALDQASVVLSVSLAKYRTRRCFAGNDGSWIKFCDRIRSISLIFVGFAGFLNCRLQEEAWSPPTLAIEMQVFRL